jgi:hypothetical protein
MISPPPTKIVGAAESKKMRPETFSSMAKPAAAGPNMAPPKIARLHPKIENALANDIL